MGSSPPNGPAPGGMGDGLALRVVSAAVLAPVAVGAAFIGGWPFLIFWTVAACIIHWEWRGMVADPDAFGAQLVGAGLGIAAVSAMLGRFDGVALGIALGLVIDAIFGRPRRVWAAAGALYAGALVVAGVLLRRDESYGITALLFLFGVVWGTDVLAYFVGRWFGGPKLWPAVSPKKTWSGAIGGSLGGIAAGLAIASFSYRVNLLPVGGLALLLSAVSQAGDLFESAIKRRFGVKDASHVIPGHGGVMDRLDGFLAAVVLAAVIGIARGGVDAPARGLLVW